MKLGVVGLPNVGKSTLFNALTKAGAESANYPFCTIEPNVGMVSVPDERLLVLAKLYNTQKITPATIEFVDIAGLVKGASKGEGLGNKFLSHIREVDAIIHVVRCFSDSDVIHVEGSVNPARDIETINLELIMADIESLEKQIARVAKQAKQGDKQAQKENELFEQLKDHLMSGKPARTLPVDEKDKDILKHTFLITLKPVIYLANVTEMDLVMKNNKYIDVLKEYVKDSKVILMCAKIESELVEFNDLEKQVFLSELGIEESGLNQLIKSTYEILGLRTFFTAGSDEVRAWTFKAGMKAPECAGIIHSDFERGFIRAEVISYDDLVKYGDEKKVKEAGKARLEGKEYEMQDGDICYFRFNV